MAAWLMSLCACTALAPVQDELSGVEIPAGWSQADAAGAGAAAVGAASLSAWWQRFDDPTLVDLVSLALQRNTSVNGAQASLRQAQALRDVAAAALWPTLDLSASAQHGTSGGHSTGNQFQAGLSAGWAPDVFGERRDAVNAADASVLASDASLGDTQVQVAAEVALDYILLRTAQARLIIATSNLGNQLETRQITDWRLQAGLVTSLESEQARAAVEQTRALLPSLQTSIVQSRHALAVLTGRPPETPQRQLDTPTGAATAVPRARDEIALSIPADTLRQRADVRAAEHQVAAALARVGQAQAQRWPSFSIGGSLGASALTLGALTNSASVLSSLLASVSLPVFDGGALRAQVRSQQAALEQARQTYRGAVLAALMDVEDALIAQRGDQARLASLREAADAAANAATLARQRYSSGLVDFQVVLETQRTQFSTQDSVVSTSADLAGDQVRLFKALGGGWQPTDLNGTAAAKRAGGAPTVRNPTP